MSQSRKITVSPAETNEAASFAHRFSRWWQNWRKRRAAVAELNCCGDAERVAHDVGLDPAGLRTLAGKWPGAANLLGQRMAQLKLEQSDIRLSEPQVLRDLQRVCTVCASKGRCAHDLIDAPSDPAWQEYCPNAPTLAALIAERSGRMPRS
jgi:hypothetical protein